jgi:hypothetical protein
MKLFGKLFIVSGVVALGASALAASDPSYSWTWNPGGYMDGVYSDNFSGYLDATSPSTWMNPGDYLHASQIGSAGALLGPNSVAVVIDPAWVGYNLTAFNATIDGIFLVNVTDTGNVTFTGASWVSTQQVGTLNHYATYNFFGSSNIFTPGPGTMAFAMSPDGDNTASIGVFSPAISNVSIAPILTAIDPNNPFGVEIVGIPVPEPATFAAIGLGLAVLAARRRRK